MQGLYARCMVAASHGGLPAMTSMPAMCGTMALGSWYSNSMIARLAVDGHSHPNRERSELPHDGENHEIFFEYAM